MVVGANPNPAVGGTPLFSSSRSRERSFYYDSISRFRWGKIITEQVRDEKKNYSYIGLLTGFFLLIVAGFLFWIAQFTRGSFWGYILVGIVGTIIFIIGFYAITRKKS